MPPRRLKIAHRASKMPPRRSQKYLKTIGFIKCSLLFRILGHHLAMLAHLGSSRPTWCLQDPPRWPQDASKTPPGRSKTPQDSPSKHQRRLQTAPRATQKASKNALGCPEASKIDFWSMLIDFWSMFGRSFMNFHWFLIDFSSMFHRRLTLIFHLFVLVFHRSHASK